MRAPRTKCFERSALESSRSMTILDVPEPPLTFDRRFLSSLSQDRDVSGISRFLGSLAATSELWAAEPKLARFGPRCRRVLELCQTGSGIVPRMRLHAHKARSRGVRSERLANLP